MPTRSQNVQMRIVKATLDRTASTQDFTVSGFGTPKFAIIMHGSSDPAFSLAFDANMRGSFGFWCANGQGAVGWANQDSVSTTNCGRHLSTTYAIAMPDYAGSALDTAYTASAVTDGIRLTKTTNAMSYDFECQVVLFGGSGILNVDVGTQDFISSANISGISDGGAFTPNWLMVISANTATTDATNNHSAVSIGVAAKDINGAGGSGITNTCQSWHMLDNQATAVCHAMHAESYAAVRNNFGSNYAYWAATAFTSGGVTGSETASGGMTAHVCGWLAVEFDTTDADYCQGLLAGYNLDGSGGSPSLSKATLTNDADNFCAGAVVHLSGLDTLDTTTSSGSYHLAMEIGFYDPTGKHGGMGWAFEEGVSLTNCGGRMEIDGSFRLPQYDGWGGGADIAVTYWASVQGGRFTVDPTYTVNSAFRGVGSVNCIGVGTRSVYAGDELAGISVGDNTVVAVYKGSTLLYGDDSF